MRNQLIHTFFVVLIAICLPVSAAADHKVTRWYGGRTAAVSVTFDDGLYSQFRIGASMMDAYGFKGSFYIMSDAGWNAWPTYWEDWAEVAAAGHEIGSHTITHAHLSSLSEPEIRHELMDSLQTIESMIDLPQGMTIAYPYGEHDALVRTLTEEYYIAGRDVWSPGYMNYYPEDSGIPYDYNAVGSFAFDYPGLTTYEILASYVDDAVAERAWFLPHIHKLDYPEAVDVLAAFLTDLQGRDDVWVDTLGNVVRYMRERGAVTLNATEGESGILLVLSHDLDPVVYNQMLTIRSTVPSSWSGVEVKQGGLVQVVEPQFEDYENVVYYNVSPNGGNVVLKPGTIDNLAPDVDAGPDQEIVLPLDSVFLSGTVSDDGLPVPPGLVSLLWSQVSGPDTVTFNDAAAEDTIVIFPAPGTYVLRLTADDGEWSVSDEMTVQLDEDAPLLTVEAVVAASSDDAEEAVSGVTYLHSSDLEVVYDSYNNAGNQTVGLRFVDLAIPGGASIIGAYVQFKVDEATIDPCDLIIRGQAADNALTFSLVNADLSNRPTTSASANWGPLEWPVVGEAALAQRTPDIAEIVQEIVDRPGWNSGQALALLITGTGKRTAESQDGDAAGAPRLVVEYTMGTAPNKPPVVNVGADLSLVLPQATILVNATVTDDGQPAPVNVLWSQVAGPAGVIFLDPAAAHTEVTFPSVGIYTLRLTANDGEFVAFDELAVEVQEEPSGIVTIEVTVTESRDDAEEATNKQVYIDSSDLELVYDAYNNAGNQTVGLRFAGLGIPAGATITNAWVQFQVDETGAEGCVLTINGQAADNAVAFGTASGDISNRPLTGASVQWTPDPWSTVNAAGLSQRTSNLANVLQEIVDRPNWSAGNALVLVIGGSGQRVAESFDGAPNGAPRLHVEFGVGDAVNKGPVVNAGPDLQLTLPVDSAWLAGTAVDDGLPLPPGNLVLAWTQVSGPGLVSFVDSASALTTAFFPAAGIYVLQLTADDGQWQVGDQVTVEVFEGGGGLEVLEVAVASPDDDAEESEAGVSYLESSDLEVVHDAWDDAGNQAVGLRFVTVNLPQGVTINSAYVQFKVDETGSQATAITIRGQDADLAAPFQVSDYNLTARAQTEAMVNWLPPVWQMVGVAGPDQRTPELASILQQIVDRPGWTSGNSLVLFFSGSGKRTAESYDGDPSGAPRLHIEYTF